MQTIPVSVFQKLLVKLTRRWLEKVHISDLKCSITLRDTQNAIELEALCRQNITALWPHSMLARPFNGIFMRTGLFLIGWCLYQLLDTAPLFLCKPQTW